MTLATEHSESAHLTVMPSPKRIQRRVLGFDVGREYLAWGLLVTAHRSPSWPGDVGSWVPARCGFVRIPANPKESSFEYGRHLKRVRDLVDVLINYDLKPDIIGIERFTYRPGSAGGGSEDVNRIVACVESAGGPKVWSLRNTDWKSWLSRHVARQGFKNVFADKHEKQGAKVTAQDVFMTSTPHEADGFGIGLFTACALYGARTYQPPPAKPKAPPKAAGRTRKKGPDESRRRKPH